MKFKVVSPFRQMLVKIVKVILTDTKVIRKADTTFYSTSDIVKNRVYRSLWRY